MLKLKYIVPATILLIVGAIFLYFLFDNSKNLLVERETGSHVCSDTVQMVDFSDALKKKDFDKMHKVYADITKLDGYSEDVSCMWMVLRYSMAVYNVDDTKTSYEAIKKLGSEGQSSDEALSDVVLNDQSVQEIIKIMDSSAPVFVTEAAPGEEADGSDK